MLSTLMQKCSLLLLPNALPCDVAGMARSDRNTGIAQLILSDLALIFWKGFDLEHVFTIFQLPHEGIKRYSAVGYVTEYIIPIPLKD